MATASTTIYRPYSYKYQPRCISLTYIAEMSFLASNSTSGAIAQLNATSNSTEEKNIDNNKTKSKPAKKDSSYQENESRSPKCWSWLTDDKDFDGIIETTKSFEKRHEHFGSKSPLLCLVKIPNLNLKKVAQKIASRKKMSDSHRNRCTFPSIDQAVPILGVDEDENNNQEADSIDPRNVDAFIREDDASWDENLSVVEMHEWLPTKPMSLQLLTSDSRSNSEKHDATLEAFDLEAFDANYFPSTNNIFRQSGIEIIATPSTVPNTSFFSDYDSKDGNKEEEDASDEDSHTEEKNKEKNTQSNETNASESRVDTSTCIQELLNITQSNSFDTVEFYEEGEEGAASDSDTISAYFSSDNLTQVHPRIVPSVSSSVASSIRGSEADDLLSIPSFPSSSSWDDDEEEDLLVFENRDAEVGKVIEENIDQKDLTGIATTEAAYFSCFKFGGFLSLMM